MCDTMPCSHIVSFFFVNKLKPYLFQGLNPAGFQTRSDTSDFPVLSLLVRANDRHWDLASLRCISS